MTISRKRLHALIARNLRNYSRDELLGIILRELNDEQLIYYAETICSHCLGGFFGKGDLCNICGNKEEKKSNA